MFLYDDIFKRIYETDKDGIPNFKAFYNGKWQNGSEFREVDSPIDGRLIARVPILTNKTILAALDSAYIFGKKEIRNYPGIISSTYWA